MGAPETDTGDIRDTLLDVPQDAYDPTLDGDDSIQAEETPEPAE